MLGLMKQFVKALNKDGTCFNYLCSVYRGLSSEKLKAGIVNVPQIRKLIEDEGFASHMAGVELPHDTPLSMFHLEGFPENPGELSEEQSERFHQDIRTMEEQYQGRRDAHMWLITAGALCVIAPKNLTRGIRIRERSFMIDEYSDHIIS
ncbi:hypothetical protein LOD99_1537 [Oopsacas minuta]|uniref:Uncharacterized protein n=1 Tax=Oopsacas minuta TaxID=111878 RepID=A0AAV7K5Z4_9METZ|nr:hypothetical protein LOD99_1532 [Oopsacas minuta]KAI6656204.1 hypothetical protein LOD99_1537 [Oopsacas minuta]